MNPNAAAAAEPVLRNVRRVTRCNAITPFAQTFYTLKMFHASAKTAKAL
jgi:hypothetical protein